VRATLLVAASGYIFGSCLHVLDGTLSLFHIDTWNFLGQSVKWFIQTRLILILSLVFRLMGILVMTLISPKYYDVDASFSTIHKVPFLVVFTFAIRSVVYSHVYSEMNALYMSSCQGSDIARIHAGSLPYKLVSYFIGVGGIWIFANLSVMVLGRVEAGAGIRMRLPPRVYPSTALGFHYWLANLRHIYDQSFVQAWYMSFRKTSPDMQEVMLAENTARFISGFSLSLLMLGAFAQWLPRILTDSDDRAKVRTSRLFELLRICLFCMTARFPIMLAALSVMPTHREDAFINRLQSFRFVHGAIWAIPAMSSLLVISSVQLWGPDVVFNRATKWLTPLVTKVMALPWLKSWLPPN
jgi:hypothetical protein